jgi:NAD(P)-dependent dehydrogenase (short-subunit alcohol dehydrogenase family)
MQGKTVVITGATSGIGEVAAESLARAGARIVFVARDPAKAGALLDRLVRANPAAAHGWVEADLSTIAAMKSAGAAVLEKAPRVDVLVNNAGAIFQPRQVTADGLEKTFAVNHMAYFVLTEILRPGLSPGARIVSTASTAHGRATLDFDDLQSSRGYTALGAYSRSKLCNILWTRELARRLEGTGVTANCLHPGVVNTGFGKELPGLMGGALAILKRLFFISSAQGAETIIYLASDPGVAGRTGGYWAKRALVEPSAAARDAAAARRLWDISAKLAGISADASAA